MKITENSLFVSDLDGTLLNKDKKLTKDTLNILNSLIDQGLMFTIATARSPATAKEILKNLDLKIPAVMMNGALIYSFKDNQYVNYQSIDDNTVYQIIRLTELYDLNVFMFTYNDTSIDVCYKELKNDYQQTFHDERKDSGYKVFYQTEDYKKELKPNRTIYFAYMDTYENLQPLYDVLKNISDIKVSFYKDIYEEGIYFLEVYSKNANKENGVLFLKQYTSCVKLVVFGDNLNDLDMMRIADESYAVENAMEDIKNVATKVIGNHNDDAVANFIAKRMGYSN